MSLRSTILASPTLSIGSRRARLLTSSAALRSPQTCFPPSALPRQQARLLPGFSTPGLWPPPFRGTLLPPAAAACGYAHPPGDAGCGDSVTFAKAALPVAGRLPAGAGHRATVVVVDDCRINASADSVLYVLVHQVRECLTIRGIGISAIGVILLYGGKVYCSYSAIWDFETIFNSRLTAKFCLGGVRRSLQALRCPQSLRAGPFVQCEGTKAVSCGRSGGNKAAKTTLLGLLCSSMSAEPPPKRRGKWCRSIVRHKCRPNHRPGLFAAGGQDC